MRIDHDDDFDRDYKAVEEKQSNLNLHRSIFSISRDDQRSMGKNRTYAILDPKIDGIFAGLIVPDQVISRRAEVGGQVKAEVSWGGNEPVKTTVSAQASVKDQHGNTGTAGIKVNNDGRKQASVEISRDPQSSKTNGPTHGSVKDPCGNKCGTQIKMDNGSSKVNISKDSQNSNPKKKE